MKSVSVIIANYNGEKYLDICLSSLEKSVYPNFDVILVDDGSTDSSLDIITKYKNRNKLKINIYENEKNLGASASRNKAIKNSTAEILIFLDNDTEVEPYWINYLVESLEPNDVGGAQSLLIDFENRDLIQSAGIFLIPHVIWGVSRMQNSKFKEVKLPNNDLIGAISAALAVKREVLNIVKGFDEKLAVSTEDLDFVHRIWIAGFKVVFSKDSIVYHYTKKMSDRKTMDVDLTKQYFHITKNSFRTIIKNYELLNAIKYLFFSIGINFVRAVLVLIKRKDVSAIQAFFKAITWNISNIFDTLTARQLVQKSRVFKDSYIYKKIMIKDSLINIYRKYFMQTDLL